MENREIRVFISSTFRDMEAERRQLIDIVFPSIRREAARRNVSIIPIDLRWGITEEESLGGKVVELCLRQIDRSRPFFIGLLGHRYGWCPSGQDARIEHRRYPRLAQYIDHGMSMTEIEIKYGVLDADNDTNAVFLIKRDHPSSTTDPGIVKVRDEILQKRPNDIFWYDSPEEIAEIVRRKFTVLLDKYYPAYPGSETDWAVQSLWNSARQIHREYIKPYGIDNVFSGNGLTLFTGSRGSGKSATAAWRAVELARRNDVNVVYLRCDSGAFTCTKKMATDILLSQLAAALPSRSDLIKDMTLTQAVAFVNKELKTQDRKLIFIVDALEEILDIDYDGLRHDFIRPMLNFGNCTIEVYINPDYESAVEFIANPYSGEVAESRVLPLLDSNQRQDFIRNYLGRYGKKLSDDLVRHLAQSADSLGDLSFLLKEIVQYGVFEKLPVYLDTLISLKSRTERYSHIIQRAYALMKSSDADSVLAVVYAIRFGLPEYEIWHDILQWPAVKWAEAEALLSALFTHNSDGIKPADIDSHRAIHEIIDETQITKAREKIAGALLRTGTQKSELAWQLYTLSRSDQLYDCLVSQGHLIEMIGRGLRHTAFLMLKELAEIDPVNYSLHPLADILELQFRETDNQSGIIDAVIRLLDFNHKYFRNSALVMQLFETFHSHFPANRFYRLADYYLRLLPFGSQVKELKELIPVLPGAGALLAAKQIAQMNYGASAEATQDGLDEYFRQPDQYRLENIDQYIDLRLYEAYLWMLFGKPERARQTLNETTAYAPRVSPAPERYVKVSLTRCIIDFLVAYNHDSDDYDTLNEVIGNMAMLSGYAREQLGAGEDICYQTERIFASMLLIYDSDESTALKFWQDALEYIKPAVWYDRLLIPAEMPDWLDSVKGWDSTRWADKLCRFYLRDRQWLAAANYYNQKLARCIDCPAEDTPCGESIQRQIAEEADSFEQGGNSDCRSVSHLLWPDLLEEFDDEVFMLAFEQLGGFNGCNLAANWRHLVENSHLSFKDKPAPTDLEGWFEVLGGNELVRTLYEKILYVYINTKQHFATYMADARITDDDSLIAVADRSDCPPQLAEILVAILGCLFELEGLNLEALRIRLDRNKEGLSN